MSTSTLNKKRTIHNDEKNKKAIKDYKRRKEYKTREEYEDYKNYKEYENYKNYKNEEMILFSEKQNEELPILIDTKHLPGPLSMKKLCNFGAFNNVSIRTGFTQSTAKTPEGRCNVLKNLLPNGTVACAFTASWIWLGGKIPNILEIISKSHYRIKPYNHRLQVFRRKLMKKEQRVIKDLHVTSPARTICDIALTPSKNIYEEIRRVDTVCELAQKYNTSFKDCEKIIDSNPYFPGAAKAKEWIKYIIDKDDVLYDY